METVSKCPETSCLSSPQARLEAAITEPWLIDMVVALMRAHLAGHAAFEEFHLWVPEIPPDKPIVREREFCPRIPKDPPNESVVGKGVFCL